MTFSTIKASTAATALALATAPVQRTDSEALSQKMSEHTDNSWNYTERDSASSAESLPACFSPALDIQVTPWTKAHDRKFRKLAAAEALGTITESQAHELGRLVELRRILTSQNNPQDVLALQRQRLASLRLMEALENYFETLNVPTARKIA